jgi:hypothetical protein
MELEVDAIGRLGYLGAVIVRLSRAGFEKRAEASTGKRRAGGSGVMIQMNGRR